MWFRGKLSLVLFILQAIFIVIFGILSKHATTTDTIPTYAMVQDVHAMIFVGFGFLMTFLKRYGFSSVSFNLMLSAIGIQWAMIIRGVLDSQIRVTGQITLNYNSMLTADFAVATVLISFGAVLGKTSHLQLVFMMMVEIVLAQINELIGLHKFHAVDMGESMYIHTFGAYFGLAVSRVLYKEDIENTEKEGSVYHSDIFSMIGTIFLWIFWPSFNSAGVLIKVYQQRAVINTLLSLCACTTVVFGLSSVLSKKGKLDMVHIQNSTLAGGVAVGACADFLQHAWAAILLGIITGTISVTGFMYLQPLLHKKLKIHDTCGVNNLHGMPGIVAGIAAAIVASTGDHIDYINLQTNQKRNGVTQGGHQLAALVLTIAIAVVSGTLTGLVMKLPVWNQPDGDDMFEDSPMWEMEETGSYDMNQMSVVVTNTM